MAALTRVCMALLFIVPQLCMATLSEDLSENFKDRPVMKIIRMLQDMEQELKANLEDDKQVYEMLDCWCNTNEKTKTKEIEVGEATVAALEASIAEDLATMKKLKAKRKATQDELWADEKALQEATDLRMKENKEFQQHETDLLEAIDAAKQAIVVLGQHHPELAQLRSVAQLLHKAGVAKLLKASGGLSRADFKMLGSFIQESQAATSFLEIPGFKSYSAQSGQIFGILKQMKADFDDDLSAAQKAEALAVKEFEELRSAKEAEIATAKKMIMEIDQQLAALEEKHAREVKELKATEEQLALDKEFLANLKKKCAMTDEEFEKRVKDRMTEINAVEETIAILNSDEAFDNFEKSLSNDGTVQKANVIATSSLGFLQISAESQEMQKRRISAALVLQQAAGKLGAASLALVATKVRLDDFTAVKAAIDKMVAELKKQQKDEEQFRDYCIDEIDTNTRDMTKADDEKNALLTKIADLEAEIQTLTQKIRENVAAMAETQNQMKRNSEVREAENEDNQRTIADQRLTQIILRKALNRMKEVYLFIQQHRKPGAPHIQTSATHTDPGNGPAGFKTYDENAGGKRVVAMLDDVLADSQKLEDDAMVAEMDAQEVYEDFMKESNQFLIATTKATNGMKEAKAKATEDLTGRKADLKKTLAHMEMLDAEAKDLHAECDYTLKNFDARQAARAAEMDALVEAKNILSGMN